MIGEMGLAVPTAVDLFAIEVDVVGEAHGGRSLVGLSFPVKRADWIREWKARQRKRLLDCFEASGTWKGLDGSAAEMDSSYDSCSMTDEDEIQDQVWT